MTDITSTLRRALRGAEMSVVRGLIFLIQLYRHMVSPLRLPTCRFTPTCSQYAVDALVFAELPGVVREWQQALARDFKVCKVNVDTNQQLAAH